MLVESGALLVLTSRSQTLAVPSLPAEIARLPSGVIETAVNTPLLGNAEARIAVGRAILAETHDLENLAQNLGDDRLSLPKTPSALVLKDLCLLPGARPWCRIPRPTTRRRSYERHPVLHSSTVATPLPIPSGFYCRTP
jgi:hypothetical protein